VLVWPVAIVSWRGRVRRASREAAAAKARRHEETIRRLERARRNPG
jgi:hypothetical protein